MPQVSVRGKIVEAGFKVLYAKGYNGCSIQDITDTAGVPKGSFYNHFKSKELLALEVLDVYVGNARIDMLNDTSLPPLERMRSHFKYMAKIYRGNECTLGCMAGNLASELSETSPLLRDSLAQRFARWNKTIAGLLREGQANGEVKPDLKPAQVGRFIIAAWEGTVLSMKLNRSMQPLNDFFDLVFPMIEVAATKRAATRKR